MFLDAIKDYFDQLPADRPPGHIGMSGIGHCSRQNAYVFHQIEGIPLDFRAKIIFSVGNTYHKELRKWLADGLAISKPCYSLVREEEEVILGSIKGHVDGVLLHDHVACQHPSHKTMLLEVKSMNDRGFNELRSTGKLSKEYGSQTSGYLRASGLDTALILVANKNTGELLTLEYKEDKELLDKRIELLTKVKESSCAEEVPREYGPKNSDGDLDWHCCYCPFVNLCWRHEGVVRVGDHKYRLNDKSAIQKLSEVTENVSESSKKNRKRRKGMAR